MQRQPLALGTDTARSDRGDRIERLVRASVAVDSTVHVGPLWVTVHQEEGPGERVEHGWKLHISSRASTFCDVVERVLPVLVAEGCSFKLARSQRVLDELNDGVTSPAAVGKAITVYPDQSRVRELGITLAEVCAGHQGPRVLSDRRVSQAAPVYYRYGPFVASPSANARGELASWLHGPDGQKFEAAATLTYQQPPWAVDPFSGESTESERRAARQMVGERYRIVVGIRESARGNVFRAVDVRDQTTVIVKQARALVSEDDEQVDTRLRLRNERRIYQVLADLPGVPRFIDHFRHGTDEFLVISDCGTATLAEDVVRNGLYQPGLGAAARGLERLAGQLARILGSVHERGVIVRDLAPSNIVLRDGQASLVDFGLADFDGLHLGGGTPGYSPARQVRDETPLDTDDLYALGMTLLFAATRLHPVVLGDDLELPLDRALRTIRATYGANPAEVLADVVDLLSGGDRARSALRRLASDNPILGKNGGRSARRPALPETAPVTDDLIETIKGSLLDQLLGQVDQIMTASDDAHAAYDGCLYTGSAGIGLELLHHVGHSGVAERVEQLATLTAAAVRRVHLPHGLYTGRTGADIFLHLALKHGIGAAGKLGGPALPPSEFEPEGDDLIVGAAGIGLGHLALFCGTGDQRHLDVARRCVSTLMESHAPESSFGYNPRPDRGVEPSAGRAHGLAGVVACLLSFAEQTRDCEVLDAADLRTRQLAARTKILISQSHDVAASPFAASWCQGLTGIGITLAHASAVLRDAGLAALACRAADASAALIPRFGTLGQCCGTAGVGSFLIDLAVMTQEQRYLDAARQVAAHMLRRSGGPPERPILADAAPGSFAASWAAGLAGMLTFFRRLSRPGGPDILPMCALNRASD